MGYLVSGNYSGEFNLQMIVEGREQVGGIFLAGVATDENDTDHEIDCMAETLAYDLKNKYVQPQNFYGVGGMRIFRDLIWLMQGMIAHYKKVLEKAKAKKEAKYGKQLR